MRTTSDDDQPNSSANEDQVKRKVIKSINTNSENETAVTSLKRIDSRNVK